MEYLKLFGIYVLAAIYMAVYYLVMGLVMGVGLYGLLWLFDRLMGSDLHVRFRAWLNVQKKELAEKRANFEDA